uniref:Uncharacterized protein n=1 Tax=Anguilla anguilla TaxID=7936 RepID=A0A0E9U7R7_ANGAN
MCHFIPVVNSSVPGDLSSCWFSLQPCKALLIQQLEILFSC